MTRVLLVDDDHDLRCMTRLMLEAAGYETSEAADGRAALAQMRMPPLPDIVVTDLLMPVMNGIDLIRALRGDPRCAALPIMVVSGSADAVDDAELVGLADAVLCKGFSRDRFLATVESLKKPSGLPLAAA